MVWHLVERGISREALEAISEDEDAAAAVGIDVMREKLRVTVISAALTALGGAIYGQYMMYLNPESVSGIAVSLQIVFAAVAGGIYSMLGPTVGAVLTISLTESLRVWFGVTIHRRRQYHLWCAARALHHFHAARHCRHAPAFEISPTADQGGPGRIRIAQRTQSTAQSAVLRRQTNTRRSSS